jgi:large subunit ribosomal protein L23
MELLHGWGIKMAELHDIILRPLETEKSARAQYVENTYVFQVGTKANKIQIKRAVESLFKVDVVDVRTVVVRGHAKRFGRHSGRLSNWKKAYVKLADGQSLDVYEA